MFVLFLIAGLVAFLLFPILRLPYLVVIGVYVALLASFSICLSFRERKLWLAGVLPFVFASIHLGAGYGSLMEFIFGPSLHDASD
jgi:hypothetical protein